MLCVQRTGWGKSAVYFVATALLRERGAGPDAHRQPAAGAHAQPARRGRARSGCAPTRSTRPTATSGSAVQELLADDAVDLLLVSPERLNNPAFRERMLPLFASRAGPARRRRGALRLGLGPRLPARLPADRRRARAAARRRRRARHDRDGERPRGRRRHRAARGGEPAHLPRRARADEPAPRGRRDAAPRAPAGVARRAAARRCRARGSSTR